MPNQAAYFAQAPMHCRLISLALVIAVPFFAGCPAKTREDLNYDYGIEASYETKSRPTREYFQFEGTQPTHDLHRSLQLWLEDSQNIQDRKCVDLTAKIGWNAGKFADGLATEVVTLPQSQASYDCIRYNLAFNEFEVPYQVFRREELLSDTALIGENKWDLIVDAFEAETEVDDVLSRWNEDIELAEKLLSRGGRAVFSFRNPAACDAVLRSIDPKVWKAEWITNDKDVAIDTSLPATWSLDEKNWQSGVLLKVNKISGRRNTVGKKITATTSNTESKKD